MKVRHWNWIVSNAKDPKMDKRNINIHLLCVGEKQLSAINMNWSMASKPNLYNINFIRACISIFKKNYSNMSIETAVRHGYAVVAKYFIFMHRTG